MKVAIKTLKKGDFFIYNQTEYLVTKKYKDDDSPLKANDEMHNEQLFHYEDLEVEKLKRF